jgi:hypothetical protein
MSNVLDLNLCRTVREKVSNDPEFRQWLATLLQETTKSKTFVPGNTLPYKINKVIFNGIEVSPDNDGQ